MLSPPPPPRATIVTSVPRSIRNGTHADNTILMEDVEDLPHKVLSNFFIGFVEGNRQSISKSDRPEKHKLGRIPWDFASSSKFRSAMSKMSQPIRGRGGYFGFLNNTNLVEDVYFLLPVKFRKIQFGGFRGEVENVLSNQRPGGHLFFRLVRKTQTW